MSMIDICRPKDDLVSLARSCGFSVTYERTPGVDKWNIHRGHGKSYLAYAGTMQTIAAFLTGYACMMKVATDQLAKLESESNQLLANVKGEVANGDGPTV